MSEAWEVVEAPDSHIITEGPYAGLTNMGFLQKAVAETLARLAKDVTLQEGKFTVEPLEGREDV